MSASAAAAQDPGAQPPRLRLLGAPALLTPRPLVFLPERRFRLAAVLALSPNGLTRDEAAALFWPERNQAAARSNLRKLILELRRLALPAIQLDGDRLAWPVASDARDLLEGRGPAADWAEPLPGLGGSDSIAFDDWLLALRLRLHDAWLALQPAGAGGRRHDDVAGDEPEFVGRAVELAELQALLGERRCRLLTLLGPGGVGKSALALALLKQGATIGADGVHWIALEDLPDAAALPQRAARELGAPVGPRSDGFSECVAALQGRQALLLLDNAEHLATLPALLERLLEALPLLRLLVTSRRRLGLAAEWVMPVAPLAPAAAQRLFVGAARRAPARQPVDPADPAVAALVEQVGRLPLALRLAATWTRHLAPAALVQQFGRSIDLLQARESPDEHPAHRSLQASFDHSWRLLDGALQQALAALSIGAGSMRMEVALATAAASPAQLAALADASLVELDAGGRVAMHPLLRRFARLRLDADAEQARAAEARHATALVTLLRPYADTDNVDAGQALAVATPERLQIELAWVTALAQRRADWLHVLAPALSGLAQAEGGVDAVLALFERARLLRTDVPGLAPEVGADLALEHATLHFWRGDHDHCEPLVRQALAIARAARQDRHMAQALNLLALVALRRAQPARAATLLERALGFARRAALDATVGIIAGNLSGIWRELGELDRARAHALQALQSHRARGLATGEVAMLAELAQLAQLGGAADEAFDWICQAEQLAARHGMALRRASLLTFKAAMRFEQGHLDDAQAIAAMASAAMQGQGSRHYHAATLHRLQAELALARGDAPGARAALRQACEQVLPLAQDVNARGLLWSLAVLAAHEGDASLAACLAVRAERGRPPLARPLPRYAALRARWPAPTAPPPSDAELQLRIDRLLA